MMPYGSVASGNRGLSIECGCCPCFRSGDLLMLTEISSTIYGLQCSEEVAGDFHGLGAVDPCPLLTVTHSLSMKVLTDEVELNA